MSETSIIPLSREAKAIIRSDSFDELLRAVDELYMHVSWCVWHEGIRIFDDSYPGNMRDIFEIRKECLSKQSHNNNAKEIIETASNNALRRCLIRTAQTVEAEHQLSTHFNWVSWHEGRRDDFRHHLSKREFNSIRLIYELEESHNANAHHLIACVNNSTIEQLVNNL